jgi:hypothetical protein
MNVRRVNKGKHDASLPFSDLNIKDVQHLPSGLIRLRHQGWVDQCERSFDQTAIIYGLELINQKVRVLGQISACGDPDSKRLRVINQVGCKGNNERRWMVCIQKRLCLQDENWTGSTGFGWTARIKVSEPDFTPFTH